MTLILTLQIILILVIFFSMYNLLVRSQIIYILVIIATGYCYDLLDKKYVSLKKAASEQIHSDTMTQSPPENAVKNDSKP
jgi:hypothetical protein